MTIESVKLNMPHAMFALKKRRQAAALQSDQRLVRRPDDHHAALTVPESPSVASRF